MRGRKPMPTHLKLLRGNPGKQRLPQNEVKPALPAQVPEPPAFLDGYAKEEWHRISGELYNMNMLTLVDINPLAAYCHAYATWRTAAEAAY
jgi:phage terminase small subunit